jgi:hypothetical protein
MREGFAMLIYSLNENAVLQVTQVIYGVFQSDVHTYKREDMSKVPESHLEAISQLTRDNCAVFGNTAVNGDAIFPRSSYEYHIERGL